MVTVKDIDHDWLGLPVRVKGVEGILESLEVKILSTVQIKKSGTDTEFEENIYLNIEDEWLRVTEDTVIEKWRTGYSPVFLDDNGIANISDKVYELEERAKEESLDGEKIATVHFWA